MADQKIEIKNWHDVPLVVTTPDQEFEIPAHAMAFVFTDKLAVRVKQAAPSTDTPGATP